MSNRLHLLCVYSLADSLLDRIRAASPRVVLTALNPGDEIGDAWSQAEVLFTRTAIPQPGQAPNLRWIQWGFAGVNPLLDSPVARSITVTSAAGIHAPQMGELAMALMLAAARQLPNVFSAQQRAQWDGGPYPSPMRMPRELRGSTLGIVGYGRIGGEIARLAYAFGMRVLAARRDSGRKRGPEWRLKDVGDPDGRCVERFYPVSALTEMLAECDYVVLVVPLTPETRGLIGPRELGAMKPTAALINLARGEVVDEAALIAALESGRIGGAALDVFTREPLPAESPLWRLPNVIVSPHLGGVSPRYDERLVDLFVENLRRYLAGEPLVNVVDWEQGY